MDIVRTDGVRYALLSESAKWRADAMLAEAIAHLGRVGNLILDRMDVLQVCDRGSVLRWLAAIAADYETIVVLATLKAPAKVNTPIITSHWLEAGAETILKEQAA
jgi:hypothetical protein